MEPKDSCELASPEKIDLLIMPCVAVDEQRNRIGRGKGFYDRFLGNHPEIKSICIAFENQISQNLKTAPHDQKVGKIITDKRMIT